MIVQSEIYRYIFGGRRATWLKKICVRMYVDRLRMFVVSASLLVRPDELMTCVHHLRLV